MNFSIVKESKIPINEQIKYQLRFQIISGELKPGAKLPSVRELADFLNVNRHTIGKAYKDLEDEELITTKQSLGTFVAEDIQLPREKAGEKFLKIVKEAMKQSLDLGFSTEEFISVAQTLYLREKNNNKKVKALFLECNKHAIDQYVHDLVSELHIDVHGFLISDIEQGKLSKAAISEYDLIITTVGHYPYIKNIIKADNIYAINIGPYLQVVGELLKYPEETQIGIICISELGSVGLKQALIDLGMDKNRIVQSALNKGPDIKEIADQVDILIVSKFALAEKGQLIKSTGKPVIEYKNVLQQTSIKMLREIIYQIERAEN